MVRTLWSGLAGLLLMAAAAPAADAPAGTWKFTFYTGGEARTLWLIKLDNAGGKWTGEVVSRADQVPETTVEDLQVADGQIRLTLKLGRQDLTFEGKIVGPMADKIRGSFAQGRNMIPAELESTKLTRLDDPFELSKEILAKRPDSPDVFDAILTLLTEAGKKKATAEDVRGWADKAFKAADTYGPRWQREVGTRITSALVGQEAFAPVALEYARRVERMLDPNDDASVQVQPLTMLREALQKNGKADEAKEVQARLDKLESKADQEYLKKMPPFKPEPFAGRKTKSDRVVLVELFTGAQCPPCVAADLAFDGLEKTYKPTDVLLLQYHLHIPGPDPLTNPDTEARSDAYEIDSTPNILFNGKPEVPGGGGIPQAQEKYNAYRAVIESLLETTAPAKIKAAVQRKGDKLDITAEVSDLEKPGEKVRLRLALVEEQIRYTGGNQLRFHHRVVRALPGGAAGLALTGKTGKQQVSVDLGELRKTLNTYLDDYSKQRPFSNPSRPMDFKKLSVVAFVQNDANKEILQATEVAVPE